MPGPNAPKFPPLNPWFLPNGNPFPGYKDQDDRCSLGKWAGAFADFCYKRCCQAHDNCYKENGCNFSSWFGNVVGLNRPCQQCNTALRKCVVRIATDKSCKCGSSI